MSNLGQVSYSVATMSSGGNCAVKAALPDAPVINGEAASDRTMRRSGADSAVLTGELQQGDSLELGVVLLIANMELTRFS
jgi:hypothetical protein